MDYKSNVEETDMYLDLVNYKEMSQLELSKKLPKWRKIFNDEKIKGGCYQRKLHLRKYCSNCDDDVIYIHSTILDHTNHNRPFKSYNQLFWNEYRKITRKLILDAEEHYKTQKDLNEMETKAKMVEHQKTDVVCECGGHYSLRNKVKHFSTQKHINFFCEESRK
jgi:hypothetical protein